MPSRVPGNSSCTAWASTCAAECRITARPSGLAAGTGSTEASASGVQARSLRSPVARSRTTTAPSGPLSGTPASFSASAAVVPAGTRMGASAAGGGAADTGAPEGRHRPWPVGQDSQKGNARRRAARGGRRGGGGPGGGRAAGRAGPRPGPAPGRRGGSGRTRSGQQLDAVPGTDPPGGADVGVDAQAVLRRAGDGELHLADPEAAADPVPLVGVAVEEQQQVGARVVGRAALGDV